MKAPSIVRLVAVVALTVILLPIVLSLYCNISVGSAPEEIGSAILAAVPLGEQIMNTVLAITGSNGEALISTLDWMNAHNISEAEALVMEVSQIFLISVIMMALETLIGLAFKKVERGIINQIANILYKVLVVFCAALFAKWVYSFFLVQVSQLTGASQRVMIYTVSILSVVGSIVALIFGGGFMKSMMKCSLKMIEALITFILGCALLMALFPWYILILIWIAVIWGCYFAEKLIK